MGFSIGRLVQNGLGMLEGCRDEADSKPEIHLLFFSAVKCQVVRAEDPADAESPPLAKHKIGEPVVRGSGLEAETQFPSAHLAVGPRPGRRSGRHCSCKPWSTPEGFCGLGLAVIQSEKWGLHANLRSNIAPNPNLCVWTCTTTCGTHRSKHQGTIKTKSACPSHHLLLSRPATPPPARLSLLPSSRSSTGSFLRHLP